MVFGIRVILLIILSQVIIAQDFSQELKNQISRFLANRYSSDRPGAVFHINNKGVQYTKSFGVADINLKSTIQPNTVFKIASVTKSITAAAVMMLAEKGEVNLEENIISYLPELNYSEHIKLKHLLTHTSGIPNYTRMKDYTGIADKEDRSINDLISIFKNKPLDFKPGEKFRYSNSNYILLSAVVQKISGKSLEEFLQENIFKPLSMESTSFNKQTEKSYAAGHIIKNGDIVPAVDDDITHTYGAGALYSTSGDLMKFWDAMLSRKLLSGESLEKMFEVSFMHSDGRPDEYGMGFWISNFRGRKVIKAEGYWNGFYSIVFSIPSENVTIIGLSNLSDFSVIDTFSYNLKWISACLLGEPYKIFAENEIQNAALQKYCGVYKIDEGIYRYVSAEGNQLYTLITDGLRLNAKYAGGDSFYYENTFMDIIFKKDSAENVTGMFLNTPEGKQYAVKTDLPLRKPITLNIETLESYTGLYDFGFTKFEVTAEKDCLVLTDRRGEQRLLPKTETEFYKIEDDSHWIIVKNEKGEVVELKYKFGSREFAGKKIK